MAQSTQNKMKYVRMGNSGLRVSKAILGFMSYGSSQWRGWVKDEDEALPIIKAAFDAGINTWDTADMYSNGHSERVLAAAMKQYSIPRSQVVIMTKAFFPVGDEAATINWKGGLEGKQRYVNNWGLGRVALFNAVEASLERLQTTYIDVFQIHRLDDTPFVEIMESLNALVQSGKVRYIGASSMWAHEFCQLQAIAEARGWAKFISMQNYHNLLYREEDREMNRYCRKTGVGLIPWSPLAGGILARPLSQLMATTRAEFDNDKLQKHRDRTADSEIINRVEEVAKNRGWTMAQVAFAWCKEEVTAPIVGVSSLERLQDYIDGIDYVLTDEEKKYLEEPYVAKPVEGFTKDRTTS